MVSTFKAFIFQCSLRITYSVNRKVHIKNEFDTKLKHVIFSRDAFSEFYQSDSRSSSFQNNWPTTVTLQGTDRKEWWVTLGTRIVLFEFVLYLDTFRQQRRRNPGKVGVEWMASFILLYSVIITLAHVWNDARKMTTNSFFRKETSIILWIYVRVVSSPPSPRSTEWEPLILTTVFINAATSVSTLSCSHLPTLPSSSSSALELLTTIIFFRSSSASARSLVFLLFRPNYG